MSDNSKIDILVELYQLIFKGAEAQGMDKAQAGIFATNVIESIQQAVGGSSQYFAKNTMQVIEKRNQEIFLKFTGHNHLALAKEFNLSVKQIYEIVKKFQHRNQMSIF